MNLDETLQCIPDGPFEKGWKPELRWEDGRYTAYDPNGDPLPNSTMVFIETFGQWWTVEHLNMVCEGLVDGDTGPEEP